MNIVADSVKNLLMSLLYSYEIRRWSCEELAYVAAVFLNELGRWSTPAAMNLWIRRNPGAVTVARSIR